MPSLVDTMRLKADQAALEADKLIRIRREQGVVEQLRRDIRTQTETLGQAAYAAYRAGEIEHPQLGLIGKGIDALNEQIAQREARIEQIRAEKLAAPAPQSGVPCPNCKQLVPAGATFCPACGCRIPPPSAEAAAVCSTCGSPMPAAAVFCATCGARKSQAPSKIACPGCGVELPGSATFCPECGARVNAAAPAMVPAVAAPEPATASSSAVAPVSAENVPSEPGESAVAEPVGEPEPLPLPRQRDEPAALPASAPLPVTKPCPSCGTQLPAAAIFCPDCGARQG